jgi:hypothetical protein
MGNVIYNSGYMNRNAKLHSFFQRETTGTHGGCFAAIAVHELKM